MLLEDNGGKSETFDFSGYTLMYPNRIFSEMNNAEQFQMPQALQKPPKNPGLHVENHCN